MLLPQNARFVSNLLDYIVSHGRTKQQCRSSRSDARNLITLVDNTRWSLSVILGMNARSLNIEKADELSGESVGLSGYFCERKDRLGRAGRGVACYECDSTNCLEDSQASSSHA